jgi:hypothetical protein
MERLRRELATGRQWADLRGVLGPRDDPSLAPNELRAFPQSTPDARGYVSVFRLLVEWESALADTVRLPQR